MRFFIKRPVLSTLFFLSILLLGVYSIKNTPVELVPEEKLPSLTIISYWRGASPEMVLQKMALPVEEEVTQLRWVRKVESECKESSLRVKVEFDERANMDLVYVLLKERLNRLRKEWPPQASFPTIVPFVPKEFEKKPFLSFALYGELSVYTLRQIAERDFLPALRAIRGVQKVEIWGGSQPQLEVILDPQRLRLYNLASYEIYSALRRNFFLSGSMSLKKDGKEITLSLSYMPDSLAEIEKIIVKDSSLNPVQLRDVARVRIGYKKVVEEKRYMGMPLVTVDVFKEPEFSSLKLSKILKEKIAEVEARLGGKIKTKIIEDESKELAKRLTKLGRLALLILAVIFVILFVVVKDFKASLLVFSSVAFSVFATFTAIYLLKIPLNLLTLSGLALGFGMFVDNAVVVFENILRLREKGLSPEEAAEKGSREMLLPVLASTVTTTVVFFSFAYFQGRLKLYYLPLAEVITLALFSSIIVAFSLIPSLAAHMDFRVRQKVKKRRGFLRFALRYPLFFLIPLGLSLFFSYRVFQKEVPMGRFFSWYQKQRLVVWLRLPPGAEFEDTKKAILQFEELVLSKPYEKEVKVQIRGEQAYMEVTFPPEIEFSAYPYILKQELISLATNMAGVGISVSGFDPEGYYYSPTAGSFLPYSITIKGYDFEKLKRISNQLRTALLRHPRIQEVEVVTDKHFFWGRKLRYFTFEIDYDALRRYDLNPQYVLYLMSTLIRGSASWMKMVFGGKEMDVQVKLTGMGDLELEELLMQEFRSPSGKAFRIKDVIKVKEEFLKGGITRENQEYISTVRWDYLGSYKRGDKIRKTYYKNLQLPPGFKKTEEEPFWVLREEEKSQLKFAILISLVLIYLVLGMLYESFVQPLLIMVSIPLALIGVFLGFTIANQFGTYPFDSTAYIGIILLSGIVVNNAIILVDHINNYRRKGLKIQEAVLEGTVERVRPVFMTAATTVAGMLPLVIFHRGEQTDIWTSLALCGVGGLTSSALLVFVVIPIFYIFFAKLEVYFSRLFRPIRR